MGNILRRLRGFRGRNRHGPSRADFVLEKIARPPHAPRQSSFFSRAAGDSPPIRFQRRRSLHRGARAPRRPGDGRPRSTHLPSKRSGVQKKKSPSSAERAHQTLGVFKRRRRRAANGSIPNRLATKRRSVARKLLDAMVRRPSRFLSAEAAAASASRRIPEGGGPMTRLPIDHHNFPSISTLFLS